MQEKKRSTYSGIDDDDDDEEKDVSPTLSREKRDNLEGQCTLITTTATTTGKTNEYNMFCNRRTVSLCQYKRRLFTQLDGELGDWQRSDVETDSREKAGRRRERERKEKEQRFENERKNRETKQCSLSDVTTLTPMELPTKKIWRKNNLMTVRHTSSCFSSICMRVLDGLLQLHGCLFSPSLPLSSLDVRTILSPQNVFDLSPVAIDATSFLHADIDFPPQKEQTDRDVVGSSVLPFGLVSTPVRSSRTSSRIIDKQRLFSSMKRGTQARRSSSREGPTSSLRWRRFETERFSFPIKRKDTSTLTRFLSNQANNKH